MGLLSFANEGPDYVKQMAELFRCTPGIPTAVGVLTMNVATLAMSLPHVSAMISRVNALLLISMPLFTKMSRGKFLTSKHGRSVVNVSLYVLSQQTIYVREVNQGREG